MLARSDVLISNSTRLISRDIPTRQSAISTRLADAWLIVAPSLRGHAAIRWGRTRIQVNPIYNLINQLIVTVLFPPNKDQAAHYINPVASPTIVAGLSFLVSSYLNTNAAPSPLGLSLGYSVLLIPSWHSAAAAGSAVAFAAVSRAALGFLLVFDHRTICLSRRLLRAGVGDSGVV